MSKYLDKLDQYIDFLETGWAEGNSAGLKSLEQIQRDLKIQYIRTDIHQLICESAEGTERVMKIVHDLKNFARSDTSSIGWADINQCLESTINIVWNQIKYVADLVREYGELPLVSCNAQQINQVFMNLLVNAVHAIQERKRPEMGSITVQTRVDHEHIVIEVRDTGLS